MSNTRKSDSHTWKTTAVLLGATTLLAIGFGVGWYSKPNTTVVPPTSGCLRLSGYTYIRPLLTCDTNPAGDDYKEMIAVKTALEKTIAEAKARGDITKVSVYLRDLINRREMSIDPDETFYPASLKKVPLMLQYYKESESVQGLLTQTITIDDPTDYNAGTTIVPKEVPQFGKSYTNAQLIDYMINYSDNISFQVLLRNLGIEKFNQAYQDLQLHYPDNITSIDDYMTAYQFSLFFRTLFNATYLNKANSESVLALLSRTDYKSGLVAGVPSEVKVAHKFGIGTVQKSGGTEQGELHDCGIVYTREHPYLLCVMTKSKASDVAKVEHTIAKISETVYSYAKDGFK